MGKLFSTTTVTTQATAQVSEMLLMLESYPSIMERGYTLKVIVRMFYFGVHSMVLVRITFFVFNHLRALRNAQIALTGTPV